MVSTLNRKGQGCPYKATTCQEGYCQDCQIFLDRMGKQDKGKKKEVIAVSAKAFVLIETAVGRNKEVVTALKRLGGVKSVDAVTGPYDVIATIEGETLNNIGDLVTAKIHPIAGISRTVSCLVMEAEDEG